ncbi:hypothetical protein NM688_g16 [Phlebia brevispora]|uniref:Uncharacterized protein n=1 Tax=Phlebia brevispora TaxID=194682 RepID=A0ACC1TFJ7_9APHY|nr:hypothetical protein NM688_g16 [Phlebia brevispora]
MPNIPLDLLYTISSTVTDPEDLKALSIVARDFVAPAQTFLFRRTTFTVYRGGRTLQAFSSFLQQPSSPIASYVHALYLRGGWTSNNRQVRIKQEDVHQIIRALLALIDLTLDQFEWLPSPTSDLPLYTHDQLKSISIRDIHASSWHESPLEVLRFARRWERIHILDLQHRIILPHIRRAPFAARIVIIDHCPFFVNSADQVSTREPSVVNIESLVMQDTVSSQASLLKQLLAGSVQTLQRLSIELCPARRMAPLSVWKDAFNFLMKCINLRYIRITVPLEQRWTSTTSGSHQTLGLHLEVLLEILAAVPHNTLVCEITLDMPLYVSTPQARRLLRRIPWHQIQICLRSLSQLQAVVIRVNDMFLPASIQWTKEDTIDVRRNLSILPQSKGQLEDTVMHFYKTEKGLEQAQDICKKAYNQFSHDNFYFDLI